MNRYLISVLMLSYVCITIVIGAPPTDQLRLWLRADAGVTVGSDGKVTEWQDQSGNNAHATVNALSGSPSSSGPVLVPASGSHMPYLNFTGNGDNGQSLEGKMGSVQQYMTVFMLMRWNPGAAHAAYAFSTGPERGGGWGKGQNVSISKEGGYYCMWGYPQNEPGHYRGGGYPSGMFVETLRFRPVNESPNLRTWANGNPQYTGRDYELPSGQGFNNEGNYAVGRWVHQGYPWHGCVDVCELLVYNKEFSENEMREIESYLTSQWENYQAVKLTEKKHHNTTIKFNQNFNSTVNIYNFHGAQISIQQKSTIRNTLAPGMYIIHDENKRDISIGRKAVYVK